MSAELLAKLLVLAAVLATTGFVIVVGARRGLTAMRTGRLLARGTVYDRSLKPTLFYAGLAFWAGMAALLIAASAILISRF